MAQQTLEFARAMDGAHDLATDPERLAALARYDILDTAPDPSFDDIVHLAARLCDAPVALVSLVDRARQWFKARIGFPECETDLESSVCRFVLAEPDVMVIPDLTRDPRTLANPLVTGGPAIRFYAGAPLVSAGGRPLGSLCVIDTAPRPQGLTPAQADDLRRLARQVMGLMEARRSVVDLQGAQVALRRSERYARALLDLGDRLRECAHERDMALAAAATLGRVLNATRAGYGRVDDLREVVDIEPDWRREWVDSIEGTHAFREFGSFIDDLKRGEIVAVRDVTQDPRTSASAGPLLAAGIRTLVNVPLKEQGRFVALLFVHYDTPQVWTEDEDAFVRNVADRVRAAIERRRAEDRLRELNATLERRVEARTRESERMWSHSHEFYLIIGHDGVYRRANPTWEREFGYTPESLAGVTFVDLVHPEDRALLMGDAGRMLGGPLIELEARVRRADGVWRQMTWTGVVGEDEIYAFGRDVTDQRAVEDALRQAQKMEAVGQLTGGLAHDFNNLLTGVTGALELLQKRVAQGRYDAVDRYVELAQGAARRAASLTQRLLAFSRRQTLDPKPTDVNRLIAGMQELIGRSIGPGVALEVVAAPDLWPTLIDPPQLENALLNLCINARDAMPEGGRLTVTTANVTLDGAGAGDELAPGDYVRLRVTDTGAGMAPDVMARIFDPFFTTKPVGQGTGLGLSTIYGFTRQSGGGVRAESQPGGGATLTLYLPRSGQIAMSAPELAAELRGAGGAGGATILLVDDETSVRLLVREVLSEAGHLVVEATDGAGALAVLRSDATLDLLVSDVGLPGGMNGRQIADAARAVRPGLKVLFMTGYAASAAVGAGTLEPGMEVLTKPFALTDLARRVADMLRN